MPGFSVGPHLSVPAMLKLTFRVAFGMDLKQQMTRTYIRITLACSIIFVTCRYWPVPFSLNRPYGQKKKEGGGDIFIGKLVLFWISNFRRVVNLTFFLLGDFPASGCYMPTFRNTVRSIFIGAVGDL